nr:host attachment protein [Pseudaminobacter manganicus]
MLLSCTNAEISELIVVAAPRTLGELRKRYHQKLGPVLKTEIAMVMSGHSVDDLR